MSAIPLLSPSRCVLIIGDDAVYVYDQSGSRTRLVESVGWGAKDVEDSVAAIIRRECKGKPVLILNDMTDQHFKGGQRMPKVGPMDRANVLQRKLTVAFPNYPIRGALPIKDKAAKKLSASLGGAGRGMYLFAAVPMSEPVSKTLTAVKQSLASIAGFTLLPIESADMVKVLADKAMKRDKSRSRWAVLIGQHMGGGLRQVITRDGQLAMTRMTPVTDMETDPQAWVAEVAQEFKATISYLSRFGYAADDGTEVFVVATPSAGQALQDSIDVPCNFTHYTVTEAADVLGVRIGPQPDQYHADPLHAAWIGRKSRFILPMEAMDIKKIYGPRQAAMVAGLVLFCGMAYLAWTLGTSTQSWMEVRNTLQSQKHLKGQVEIQYQAELEKMKALGFDISLIQSSLKTFDALEADGLHPLALVQAIGKALGPELRIDKLEITRRGPLTLGLPHPPANTPGLRPDSIPTVEAVMVLSFPPTIDPAYGVNQINDLSRKLSGTLPQGYKVAITKQVADLTTTQNTVGEVGHTDKNPKQQDYRAEITIRGPLQ